MSEQSIVTFAAFSFTRWIDLFLAFVTPVASWARALLIVALIDLSIRITKLDRNVSLQLVLESHSLHS